MATKKEPLDILFGSAARVKLLRFFLFNPSKIETFDEVSKRAKLVRRTARTEIDSLEKAGVIKKRTVFIDVLDKEKKLKAEGYALNKDFPELQALQTFLFETAPINGKTVLKHLRTAVVVDFLVVTGVFMREFDRRLDVLITAKKMDDHKIANAIRSLEAELGIDIRFAAMTTEDLRYRISMHDKLIRDVFDYTHEVVIDKQDVLDEIRIR